MLWDKQMLNNNFKLNATKAVILMAWCDMLQTTADSTTEKKILLWIQLKDKKK